MASNFKRGDKVSLKLSTGTVYEIAGERDGQFRLSTPERGICAGAWANDLVLVEAA